MSTKKLYIAAVAALIMPALSGGHSIAGDRHPGLGKAPGSYTITGDDPVRIPFTMHGSDIMMDCEINGVRCQMLIDNGVLMDELMFFGNDTCDSLGLVLEGGMEVGGSGEGEPPMADSASNVALSFPGIEFSGQPAVVMRKEAGMGDWWPGVEGQVSAVFFKHFVTEIDFDKSVIILHRPEAFEYAGTGHEVPLEHLPDGSWMFPATVKVTSGGHPVNGNLMLDLGGVNPILLFLGDCSGIRLPAGAQERILGYGVQGAIRGYTARVHSVRAAGYELKDVFAGFQEPDGRTDNGQAGVAGMPFFQRFNIIFDYFGGRMILEPGRGFTEPFCDPFEDSE